MARKSLHYLLQSTRNSTIYDLNTWKKLLLFGLNKRKEMKIILFWVNIIGNSNEILRIFNSFASLDKTFKYCQEKKFEKVPWTICLCWTLPSKLITYELISYNNLRITWCTKMISLLPSLPSSFQNRFAHSYELGTFNPSFICKYNNFLFLVQLRESKEIPWVNSYFLLLQVKVWLNSFTLTSIF